MKEFTLVVSADKTPTLNVVLLILKKIKMQLTTDTDSDDKPAAIWKMKMDIWENIEKRKKKASEMMQIASCMDPRLKTLAFLPPEERQDVRDATIKVAFKLTEGVGTATVKQ